METINTYVPWIALLISICTIVFQAGAIPEKFKALYREINRLESEIDKNLEKIEKSAKEEHAEIKAERDKQIEKLEKNFLASLKRVHEKFEEKNLVSREDCNIINSRFDTRIETFHSTICSHLETMKKRQEDMAKTINTLSQELAVLLTRFNEAVDALKSEQ